MKFAGRIPEPSDGIKYLELQQITICTLSLNGREHYDRAYTRTYTTEVVQGRTWGKITSHASVVAETVPKILDVMIAWKIDDIGRINADITQ